MTFTVTASKASPDSKVGLTFGKISKKGALFVRKISDGGLFASSDLDVYDEITKINGTDVTKKSVVEATDLIKAAAGQVTIEAQRPHEGVAGAISFQDLQFNDILSATDDEAPTGIKQLRERMPKAMLKAGVPLAKWEIIYDAIQSELLPPTKKALLLNDLDINFNWWTDRYGEFSEVEDFGSGFGLSDTDVKLKKMRELVQVLSQQIATTCAVASDIQSLANRLLAPYGLIARKVFLNVAHASNGKGKDLFKKCGSKGEQKIECDNYICFGLKFVPEDAKPEAFVERV